MALGPKLRRRDRDPGPAFPEDWRKWGEPDEPDELGPLTSAAFPDEQWFDGPKWGNFRELARWPSDAGPPVKVRTDTETGHTLKEYGDIMVELLRVLTDKFLERKGRPASLTEARKIFEANAVLMKKAEECGTTPQHPLQYKAKKIYDSIDEGEISLDFLTDIDDNVSLDVVKSFIDNKAPMETIKTIQGYSSFVQRVVLLGLLARLPFDRTEVRGLIFHLLHQTPSQALKTLALLRT